MSRVYDLSCIWHTYEDILRKGQTMDKWLGRIVCDEHGFFNGVLQEPNEEGYVITDYIVGFFDEDEGISMIKTSLLQRQLSEDYSLSKDKDGGYGGAVSIIAPVSRGHGRYKVTETEVAGARIKAKEVDLSPEEFNNTQRQIEDARQYMIKSPFAQRLIGFIEFRYEVVRNAFDKITEMLTEAIEKGKK